MEGLGYNFESTDGNVQEQVNNWRLEYYTERQADQKGSVAGIAAASEVMMEEAWIGHTHSATHAENRHIYTRTFVEEDGVRTKLTIVKKNPLPGFDFRMRHKIHIGYYDGENLLYEQKMLIFDMGNGNKKAAVGNLMYDGGTTKKLNHRERTRYATKFDIERFSDELHRLWELQEDQDAMLASFYEGEPTE